MTPSATHPDCDEELMRKIAEGDPAALAELFDRYGDRAYRVAVAACEDYELAVDAVRDGFLTCWKTSTTYAQRGSVPAWLLATVRQRAIEARRRRRLAGRGLTAADGGGHTREIAELAYFGQLTQAEIAAQLDLAAAPPETRLSEAG